MKKIRFILGLLLISCLTACAGGGTIGDFAFTEEGYVLEGISYGDSVEQVEKALGHKLEDYAGGYSYDSYKTGTAKFLGLEGYFDAQFDENGFYSITFNAYRTDEDMQAAFDSALERYTKAFGKPDDEKNFESYNEVQKTQSYTQNRRWVDAETGTIFMFAYTEEEEKPGLFQISIVKPPVMPEGAIPDTSSE